MKHAAAIAHIRQLCCLGLGGQAIMPALLRAISKVIPSSANVFLWADANREISDVYFEEPGTPESATIYLSEFYNKRECEVQMGFSEVMRVVQGVINSRNACGAKFFNSDLYNLVFRPSYQDAWLKAVIRENCGRALGALLLTRPSADPQFGQRDEETLLQLVPYIAHGLHENANAHAPFSSVGDSGLIIVDGSNTPVHMSPEGKRLLFLATHPRITSHTVLRVHDAVVAPAIVRLCDNLRGVFAGKITDAPVLEHNNPWGKFVFRAYRLYPEVESVNSLIGVTIERREPWPLKAMRTMESLPLSPKQKEVCLLLLEGVGREDILHKLQVSGTTLRDHLRKIYSRLDVHSREELLMKLH